MTNIKNIEQREKLAHYPEQLESSRLIGTIPESQFPWMHGPDQVSISELDFGSNSIYVASAISSKLAKLTEAVRSKDKPVTSEDPYSSLDGFLLHAAQLEASGEAMQSPRIGLQTGGVANEYSGFAMYAYKESQKPNTRRMYYLRTKLSTFAPKDPYDTSRFQPAEGIGGSDIDYDKQLIIRLGYADKTNQVDVLHKLTGASKQSLKKKGAG